MNKGFENCEFVKRTVSWPGRHDEFRGTEPIELITADTPTGFAVPRNTAHGLDSCHGQARRRRQWQRRRTCTRSPAPDFFCVRSVRPVLACYLSQADPFLASIPSPSPSVAPQIPILCRSTRGPPISSVFSLVSFVSGLNSLFAPTVDRLNSLLLLLMQRHWRQQPLQPLRRRPNGL